MGLGGFKHFLPAKKKENVGFISGPLFFIVILFAPFPQSITSINTNQNHEGFIFPWYPQIALGTMVWMVIWWITECVPLGFTSLLAPFIFITSGILTVNQALPKFSDPIIWIFISGFILAAAFKKCGLDMRIAYKLATFYKGSNPRIAIFFIACLPVFLLSVSGSITASTTIVFPFVLAYTSMLNIPIDPSDKNKIKVSRIKGNTLPKNDSKKKNNSNFPFFNNNDLNENEKDNDNEKRKYAEASFLSLGQAATAGAMLLLISTAPNLIAKSTVEDFAPGKTISFTDWFVIGLPHAIIGLLITWNVVFLIIRPKINSISAIRDQFRNSLNKIGKITTEEKTVLMILLLAMILWILPSLIRSFYPMENVNLGDVHGISILLGFFSKNIPESVPALLIILAIGLIRVKRVNTTGGGEREGEEEAKHSTTLQPILNWSEMLKAIDWNIIFLFGGGLVLGLGIESSGLATWFGTQITHYTDTNLTEFSIFAISAMMGFVMSYAASNTASAVIMCPVAASLAVGAGFNPIPPIIAAALAASISSAIPSTTPPMAIIYSSRLVSILNMFKTGIVSDLLRMGILITLGPVLISLIFTK